MTAPGDGVITALAVVSAFDDAARFRRSSSAGAWLGLTPRRSKSGEISRNGRVSKRGGPRLRPRAKAIAERTGPGKAKVALAWKLAVILHAMRRTHTPVKAAPTA